MYNAILRRGLPALLLLIVGTVAAQPPGEVLKQSEAERQIKAQQLEVMFAAAIRDAKEIGSTQPRRAVDILQGALAQINADATALKDDRREAMRRKLKLDLDAWSEKANYRPVTPGTVTQPPRSDTIGTDDSKRVADAAKDRIDQGKKNLGELKDTQAKRAEADLAMANLIRKAGIPEYRDITFPRNWEEIVRKRTSGVKMTEKEKAIIKALSTSFENPIEYKGMSFKDVIDDLQKRTGLPLIVDQRALDEAGVKYETEVNLSLGRVTTRTVLKKLLADLNLTYVVKDQAVQITTPARAKDMLSIRTYSVADLMPAADMRMPLVLNQIVAYQTLQQLVVLITQSVEPDSWEVNGKGGLGTIAFDPTRFMLVVKQTAEIHYLMGLTPR